MTDMAPRSVKVRANGIEQHYLEWPGSAEKTVLLFHGYLDHSRSFVEVGTALARAGHRVIAPDFRGHGESGWVPPGGYYHFPDYVADIAALLAKVAPREQSAAISVIGHSMGGTVATLVAGTFPDRVRALALIEGVGPPEMSPDIAPDRFRRWLDDLSKPNVQARKQFASLDVAIERLRATHGSTVSNQILAEVARHLTVAHPSGTGLTWRFDPLHQTVSPSRFELAAFAAFARRIDCPVLLVDAGASGFTFMGDSSRDELFAKRQSLRLDGAGHMMHWTEPAKLSAALVSFLRESGA